MRRCWLPEGAGMLIEVIDDEVDACESATAADRSNHTVGYALFAVILVVHRMPHVCELSDNLHRIRSAALVPGSASRHSRSSSQRFEEAAQTSRSSS